MNDTRITREAPCGPYRREERAGSTRAFFGHERARGSGNLPFTEVVRPSQVKFRFWPEWGAHVNTLATLLLLALRETVSVGKAGTSLRRLKTELPDLLS